MHHVARFATRRFHSFGAAGGHVCFGQPPTHTGIHPLSVQAIQWIGEGMFSQESMLCLDVMLGASDNTPLFT